MGVSTVFAHCFSDRHDIGGSSLIVPVPASEAPLLRRRPFLLRWFLACASLALAACSKATEAHPNVILIVVDTLRGDALKMDEGRLTPNMRALAEEGVAFPLGFTMAPLTLPAHTALFSSRPPLETGVTNNGMQVSEDLPLLADWMGRHGYSRRAVVSLGTMTSSSGPGLARGFDVYDQDFWRADFGERVLERLGPHLDAVALAAPFFLFVHFSDPHGPNRSHGKVERRAEVLVDGALIDTFLLSEEGTLFRDLSLDPGRHVIEVRSRDRLKVRLLEVEREGVRLESEWELGAIMQPIKRVKVAVDQDGEGTAQCKLQLWATDALDREETRERYWWEAEFVDACLGKLIAELEGRGLFEDALILFTADHGEALGEHDMFGHGHTLFDELIHVPMIVKPPRNSALRGRLQEQRNELFGHVDLVPTILDLCALPELPDQRGQSILAGTRAFVMAETHRPQARRNLLCFRDKGHKLIFLPDEDRFELYDLQSDPGETNDLWGTSTWSNPEWESQLRTLAALAAKGGLDPSALDPETLLDLKALGY